MMLNDKYIDPNTGNYKTSNIGFLEDFDPCAGVNDIDLKSKPFESRWW